MLDYLLAEKNFTALKQYVDFLRELPKALEEINRFSDGMARAGHTLLSPPNAPALIQVALANAQCWGAIGITVPLLGNTSARILHDMSSFISEFQAIVSVAQNRRLPISVIDPQQFTVVRSADWGSAPCADVIDVLRELDARLGYCQHAVSDFKAQVTNLAESIHGIFVRFIESLTMPLCSCDGPIPKIEAYYVLGRVGLPGMGYDPGQWYSEEQRQAFARAHVGQLFNLHRRAGVAASNLGDFCFRWVYMLDEARRTLQTHHSNQTMARAKASLPLITDSLSEVDAMSRQLVQMAEVL
ncbi:hypothetical protein [Pseudomonas sp. GM55]|uniref:hypothetical protein n=1 Tax=Pseudomonas sp. GM55 TaxID=1144333 RepID=UPI0002707788|nr:hypothetical protein [Pseudomonas sp. GM55]EJM73757.1 hypothetical protein PMI31_02928 [Pseudomonas sp. GM55]